MDLERLEIIRKNVEFVKGLNLNGGVYFEYCRVVPELLEYIEELGKKQIPRLPRRTSIDERPPEEKQDTVM